jgi:hypothetical protein
MIRAMWRRDFNLSIHPLKYLLYAVAVSLLVRGILGVFKMGPVRAEHENLRDESALRLWWRIVCGLDKYVPDYLLAAFIGFAEAAAYPVIFVLAKPEIIGAWIAIKTAGGWEGWQKNRPSFDRFLLGNLLVLAFAYFWLSQFVSKVPSAPAP